MHLQYENKISLSELLAGIPDVIFTEENTTAGNLLLQSENLTALKYLLGKKELAGKVDLIYIDPPFASNNTFRVDADGRTATISKSNTGTIAYTDNLLGTEFLEFLRRRLMLLKLLLSDRGSIYLHIDYKIGHYVKVIMDEVFGIENFRNDITRIKCNPKNFSRKAYGNIKDLILFYSKGPNPIWNEPVQPYTEEDIKKLFGKTDADGRSYTTIPLHAPGETQSGKTGGAFKGILPPKGRHWRSDVKVLEELDAAGLIEWSDKGNPRKKIFVDEREGKRMQDIWELKDPQYPVYPTEKNADLLNLILKTSSNEGSLVLDCFAGSGTTLKAAEQGGRRWIGIDQSEEAIKAIEKKLGTLSGDLFQSKPAYEKLTVRTENAALSS